MTLDLRSRRFLGQFIFSLLFLLLLAGHVGQAYNLFFVEKLDAALYDLKLRMFRAQTVDERVVIVDIDDKSLKEIGRWPWPREQVAKLTRSLFEQYGVAAIGYDVVFSEPDQSSGLPVLEKMAQGPLAGDAGFAASLARIRPQLDYDGKLAVALESGASIMGYYFNFSPPVEVNGQLPAPLFPCAEITKHGVTPRHAVGYNANLKVLQDRAGGAAFFNMEADFDGVARRMPVLMEHAGLCYGSLAFLTAGAGMGIEVPKILPAEGHRPTRLDLDGLRVPLDARGNALVPYRTAHAFRYVSASDVIHEREPSANLEGRIVLIGSTAPGIMDLRVTPVSKILPGVEIHASLISGILDGTVKWEPVDVRGMELAALAVAGLLLAALLPAISPLWAAFATAVLGLLLTGGNFYAWSAWHAHLPLAASLLAVLGLFVLNMSYGFFVEARSKAQITKLFGQYIPPELVDEMAKDPARYSLRGESKVMTVLFSDIVSFTSFSEKLEAAQLAEMLNMYLSAMTRIVQEGRGTIDKYIGDAVMAFWGAPMSDEHHARDAVLVALAMQKGLVELNPRLQAKGWPPVKIGVGVNTGRMSVGNMGSEFRMAYTVMADAVNLASRLEALTRQYGVGVLVGEATRADCPDLSFQLIDRVRVKGKDVPVTIHEPLGITAELPPERLKEAALFEAAYADYQARRWDDAEIKLMQLSKIEKRKLYQVYLDRATHFRFNPPPADWDGVFTYTSK
ncbi:MAG: adenylate/guanylate cyclase domain-containing protein [Pseudomonadota bacterium]|nr:adenylate/guanylate cyclase domain-containing protein [Pseudomonadota bacterium]MDP1905865.1 adenylate/guanylate cyclase domain-containing protein [Pseudomonadota bacterium]MDP2351737.1 adenylate/guanylate cyclase domain-containing protein [Pseudomonadota bacterium]